MDFVHGNEEFHEPDNQRSYLHRICQLHIRSCRMVSSGATQAFTLCKFRTIKMIAFSANPDYSA
jgi:hypothetical protein